MCQERNPDRRTYLRSPCPFVQPSGSGRATPDRHLRLKRRTEEIGRSVAPIAACGELGGLVGPLTGRDHPARGVIGAG